MLKRLLALAILAAAWQPEEVTATSMEGFGFGKGMLVDSNASDKCFCQLKGQIDDCSCTVDTVDFFNNKKIHPRLQSLLQKDYFRYFKYNARKQCPFWNNDAALCRNPTCGVKACTEEELPPGLKNQAPCGTESDNGSSQDDGVDSTISDAARKDINSWRDHDESQLGFCELDPVDFCPDCDYVDLTRNPERFTGYSGEDARRVWRAIYEENCFKPVTATAKDKFSAAFLPDSLAGMCLEKRAFYRAVSGLHTSITIHLSARHPKGESANGGGASLFPGIKVSSEDDGYGPNLPLFLNRFDPEMTKGMGPYWLKNVYFVYLLELRALTKAAPLLEEHQFYTGNDEEDKETSIAVKELLNLMRSFPDHFDEHVMFSTGNAFQRAALKEEFREHFRNISRVMDCVACDKCKLWGKLQITGLGTALKILFSQDEAELFDNDNKISAMKFSPDMSSEAAQELVFNASDSVIGNNAGRKSLKLTRNEIVALFNAFGRISTSIQQLEKFRQLMKDNST